MSISQKMKLLWQNPAYRNHMIEVHKNKKQSPETIKKRMLSVKRRFPQGYKHSEERKIKISSARKGIIFSEEHRKNIGLSQQKGKNHNWKGGSRRYYQRIANAIYREFNVYMICEQCDSPNDICIHHKDNNVKNNHLANLQALCRSCHIALHHRKTLDGTMVKMSK